MWQHLACSTLHFCDWNNYTKCIMEEALSACFLSCKTEINASWCAKYDWFC